MKQKQTHASKLHLKPGRIAISTELILIHLNEWREKNRGRFVHLFAFAIVYSNNWFNIGEKSVVCDSDSWQYLRIHTDDFDDF